MTRVENVNKEAKNVNKKQLLLIAFGLREGRARVEEMNAPPIFQKNRKCSRHL